MPCWCQRRMGRLVRDDRKATVTQITTRYNQDLQNTISEHTTHRTLKQMGSSSTRPHRVPLLSDKNRKRRIPFAQAHQNWTIEDWKNVAWSAESRFLLQHSDGRVRIWCNEHESMDSSCLVSSFQAGGGGVMVWGYFLGTLWALSTNWASFKCHSLPEYCCWQCSSLYAYSVTIFWCYFKQYNAHVTKLKSSQTGFLNMTMSSLYSNGLHSHQISIQ